MGNVLFIAGCYLSVAFLVVIIVYVITSNHKMNKITKKLKEKYQ